LTFGDASLTVTGESNRLTQISVDPVYTQTPYTVWPGSVPVKVHVKPSQVMRAAVTLAPVKLIGAYPSNVASV